jgi:glycine betaine catabolism B
MPEKLLKPQKITLEMITLQNNQDETIKAEVIGIRQETPDVKTFRLKPAKQLEFIAGQFIFLYVTINNEKLKGAYSIASYPLDKGYIEITIKKENPGNVSVYMNDLAKKGDIFEISGPFGKFSYDDNLKEVVFIAGGAGIVPFRGIIRYILQKKLPTKVTLLYSTKTKEDILFRKEFDYIKSNSIKIIYTLTRDDNWEGHKGRIDSSFISENLDNLRDKMYFLCGPLEFIRAITDTLSGIGVDSKKIKRDIW